MKTKPLDDMEMHQLLRLIYPEHIRSDADEYFELSADICDSATVNLGDGFEPKLSDILGRVAMLTMPIKIGLTQRFSHCLGEITIKDGEAQMITAVRRDVPNL